MQVAGLLSGGAPVIKKYQVAETFGNAGVPATITVTTEAGVNLGTVGTSADIVGTTLDTATYSTTQGSGASSAEALVSVVINPDAIIRARLSGGATDGTDLSAQSNTTESTTGLIVVTGAEWSSPTFLDGVMWGISGANVGQKRNIVVVDGTSGDVLVPFDYTIAVGDTFGRVPFAPMGVGSTVQLTTNLTEVDASAAIASDIPYTCIDNDLNGLADSYADLVANDHMLNKLA